MTDRGTRQIVYYSGIQGAHREARVVAELHADGHVVAVPDGSSVAILHEGMLLSPRGGLWSVRLDVARTIPSEQASRIRANGVMVGSSAWPHPPKLDVDVAALLPPSQDVNGSSGHDLKEVHGNHGKRLGKGGAHLRPRRPSIQAGSAGLPEHVVIDKASKLVTGLVLETGVEQLKIALTGKGIPLELDAAPDYVWLSGAGWASSANWPAPGGRLFAPADAAGRLFETVVLGFPSEISKAGVLGVRVLSCPRGLKALGSLVDWRDDRQVLADAPALKDLVQRASIDPGDAEALDRMLLVLAAESPWAPAAQEEFRLRRLIEVAIARAEVPAALAAIIPSLAGIDDLVAQQLNARRAELSAGMEADIERERQRLDEKLEAVRLDVQAAEARGADLAARELVVRRALDEARSELDGAIERRVEAAVRVASSAMQDVRAKVEAVDARLAEIAGRVDQSDAAAAGDLYRAAREEWSGLTQAASRIEERLATLEARVAAPPRVEAHDPAVVFADVPQEPAPVVSSAVQARARLRWHARGANVGEDTLRLGVASMYMGLLPLFVGEAAADAAIALAEAIAGSAYGSVACDPTLISASDLLDPRRARVDAVLDAIERSRSEPATWHAAVLVSIDLAPCAYWLSTFSSRRFGNEPFPPNLLVVASTDVDGPRNPIPKASLRRVSPIAVTRWGGGNVPSCVPASWAVETGTIDPGRRSELSEAFMDFSDELSPTLMRQVSEGGSRAAEVFAWTPEQAREAIRPVVDWLSFASGGRPPSKAAADMFSKLGDGGE